MKKALQRKHNHFQKGAKMAKTENENPISSGEAILDRFQIINQQYSELIIKKSSPVYFHPANVYKELIKLDAKNPEPGRDVCSKEERTAAYKTVSDYFDARFGYSVFQEIFPDCTYRVNPGRFEFRFVLVAGDSYTGNDNNTYVHMLFFDFPLNKTADNRPGSAPIFGTSVKELLDKNPTCINSDLIIKDRVFLAKGFWTNKFVQARYSKGIINNGVFKLSNISPLIYSGQFCTYEQLQLLVRQHNAETQAGKLLTFKAQIEELEKLAEEQQKSVQSYLAGFEKSINELTSATEEKENETIQLKKNLDELKENFDNLNSQKNKYEKAITEIRPKIDELKPDYEALKEEAEELDKNVKALSNDVRDKLDKNRKLLDELKEHHSSIHASIEKSRDEYYRFIDSASDTLKVAGEIEKRNNLYEKRKTLLSDYPPEKLIRHVRNHLWHMGYRYPGESERILKRFISTIGSGQLILLCGKPGSGKTSLTEMISAAIGARTKTVVVQPNWTDSQDLLGYYDSENAAYIGTEFLSALEEAKESECIYFIVLDELNLSRVEYYFSSLLSAMERGRTLNLISSAVAKGNPDLEKYVSFSVPENVQFVGTINLDDLSKELSPKVLDRSILIDLSEDLYVSESSGDYEIEISEPVWDGKLPPEYFANTATDKETSEKISFILEHFEELCRKMNSYKASRNSIYGEDIRISHRFANRITHMVNMGADFEDILITKFLPALNWEMSPDDWCDPSGRSESSSEYDFIITDQDTDNGLKKILMQSVDPAWDYPESENHEKSSLEMKLDAMADVYGDRLTLDYMKSSRR